MRLPSGASEATIRGGAKAGVATFILSLLSSSRPYLRELHECIDGLRNRERSTARDCVRRRSAEDSFDRRFQLLSGESARDGGDGVDRVRHVAWRQLSAKCVNDPPAEGIVEVGDDEQDQLARAALVVLDVHHEAVLDLGDVLDYGVELARSHTDTATVQGRIRAPGDDAGAGFGEAHPVAVAPDA